MTGTHPWEQGRRVRSLLSGGRSARRLFLKVLLVNRQKESYETGGPEGPPGGPTRPVAPTCHPASGQRFTLYRLPPPPRTRAAFLPRTARFLCSSEALAPAALSVWALRGVFLKPRGVPGARPRSAESKPAGGGSWPLRRLATRATPTRGQCPEPLPQDAADCAAAGQARPPGFRLSRKVS